MAETRTSRLRLVQWSSGTDSPQRVDFNETFLNIETLAAIDQQGTISSRPAQAVKGSYYFATDQGMLYRSDGSAWAVVGSSVLTQLVRPARTDDIAQTVQGLASQTGDLQRVLNSANAIYQRVTSGGDYIHGPLRVTQAAKAVSASDTSPSDSAVSVDNGSNGLWNTTLLNTTGNTIGFFRAVRGGSTVFSIGTTGAVTTPSVTLTSEPTATTHATTKNYVDTKVSSNVYTLDGTNLSGVLPVTRGGTGGTTQATARTGIGAAASATTINAGAGLTGGGDLSADRTLTVNFPTSGTTYNGASVGTSNAVSRYDHSHSLAGNNIIGVLPIANGGTGRPDAPKGGYLRGNATGTLYDAVTPASVLADIGASASNHGHALTDANITGILPVGQGGTGATTVAAARTALAVPINTTQVIAGAGLSGGGTLEANRTLSVSFGGSGAASTVSRSDHGHVLTDANITGILPVGQGGTGATTVAAARTALGVPVDTTAINTGAGLTGGGNLTASRTLSVTFGGTGTATTAARSDHTHTFSGILGSLSRSQIEKAIPLGEAVDLNDYTSDGVYHQGANNSASNGRNYPANIAGLLIVYAQSNMVYQIYIAYNTGTMFIRTKYGSTWYAWDAQATNSQVEGLTDTLAPKVHGHALTDANITGILPLNQGGTGASTAVAARTALGVPSNATSILAGAGLSGGGNLTADRTLQVVFEGTGTKDTVARSDHGHDLGAANITGKLPVTNGGTGLTTVPNGYVLTGGTTGALAATPPVSLRQYMDAAPKTHSHNLGQLDITGILPVSKGGTGVTSLNSNQFVLTQSSSSASETSGFTTLSDSAVRTRIGATSAADLPYRYANVGSAPGWNVFTGGISVVKHKDGGYGCSLEITMTRSAEAFTQGTSFMVHGNFVTAALRPNHVSGQYFWAMLATTEGIGYINWETGQFSARVTSGSVVMSQNARIAFNLSWVVTP